MEENDLKLNKQKRLWDKDNVKYLEKSNIDLWNNLKNQFIEKRELSVEQNSK